MRYSINYLCLLTVLCTLTIACEVRHEDTAIPSEEAVVENRKLFIIGGGSRSDSLMLELLNLAEVGEDSQIKIITWATSEPDTSYFYAKRQLSRLTNANIDSLSRMGWKSGEWDQSTLLDASLVYISGGDQSRFMKAIEGSEVKDWMHKAVHSGTTISGTSAGAAIMSEIMLTGDQNYQKEYSSTYRQITSGNAIYSSGLGFLDEAIIDQHFIARSRQNRLLTALYDHPGKIGIGIDESTALWVDGMDCTVKGAGQVQVYYPPKSSGSRDSLISMMGIQLDLLIAGDRFKIE